MKPTKILINYDAKQDPGTTGYYFKRAALARPDLEVFTQYSKIPDDIGIVFNIQPCPAMARSPRAVNVYYEIDNHITMGSDREKYRLADILYIAQPYFGCLYDHPNTRPLYLGYDPDIHTAYKDEAIIYDVGLLGNATYFERQRLLDMIAKKYTVLRGTRAPGELYARGLSQCKVLFNRSLDHDINMRFFESIGFGRPFLTDRLLFQSELFCPDQDFWEYESDEELMSKLDYIFANYKKCLKQAQAASDLARAKHTYAARLDQVLADCAAYRKENPCPN